MSLNEMFSPTVKTTSMKDIVKMLPFFENSAKLWHSQLQTGSSCQEADSCVQELAMGNGTQLQCECQGQQRCGKHGETAAAALTSSVTVTQRGKEGVQMDTRATETCSPSD